MILIVDDIPENIFSLKSLLSLHGFKTDSASSGEEALKKVLQNSYSLVILDVQMPEMDGFEVAEAMLGSSKFKDLPIIFLSALNTHKKFITKGYESGGMDYVTKPFDPDILLLKVKAFYKLSEQTRKLYALETSLRKEIDLRKEAESILEKKVEERTRELTYSNMRLKQSNQELQQFTYIASHDLQEPLRKIQTFSNLALDKHSGDESRVRTYFEKINSSAGRLRSLITELLEYARINTEDVFVKTDLSLVVQETLDDLELSIKSSNAQVHIGPLPAIDVVPMQMRQVFQNLISNALKFTRKDVDCTIDIKSEYIRDMEFDSPAMEGGGFCRITVRDNGIGFSENHNVRVFEIFQRLNNREFYEGTGIGLAIVKKVIERHEGLIRAEGKDNEGATFTIILPASH